MQNNQKKAKKKKKSHFWQVFNYHIENMEIGTFYLMKANETWKPEQKANESDMDWLTMIYLLCTK